MLYNIKRNNYRNFKIIEDNRLPGRSYFIPFSNEKLARESDVLSKRYSSDIVECLNGEWDFAYFPQIDDVPRNFETDKIAFDKIPVPSCWQFLGYEPPFYTNIVYPFNPKPPFVPIAGSEGIYGDDINGIKYVVGKKQYNSVGVYRKMIGPLDLNMTHIISFLGVSSSVELYCNGKYVGYGEGSHNTSEFDITKFLLEGDNEILVVVHKWCTGSYLEDQDMFRNNGIFRDVLLYSYQNTHIFDVDFFSSKNSSDLYDAIVSISVIAPVNNSIVVTLRRKGKIVENRIVEGAEDTKVMFPNLKVDEWSSEVPNLYELTVLLLEGKKVIECIIKNIAFKTISIREKKLLLNGQKIKIMGVNHHDTHPENGYYLTPKDIERDIFLCKNFNVNTIRTSHYPPDPLLVELADIYGIYLILEADIETHGLNKAREISSSLKWKNHFWDRVKRMYLRDRNSPSIIIWSLGNESSGIKCQDFCYKKLGQLTILPILYEGACRTRRGAYDIGAVMYPSIPNLERMAKGKLLTGINPKTYRSKPLLLVEYAHAMGVSAGNLKEYWETFFAYDNLVGGCIWEMVDHAVKHGEDKEYKWTYGGDHGEYLHDGNFCVDGLFYPDRTPHTGAYQMKNVYRPLRARALEPGIIEIKNINSFRNADYLKIKGHVLNEGEKVFIFDLPSDIEPLSAKKYDLNFEIEAGDWVIHLEYFDGENLVGWDELVVSEKLTPIPALSNADNHTGLLVKYAGNVVNIDFGSGNIRFDKVSGNVLGYSVKGKEYFARKPSNSYADKGRFYHNIYRAPFDNDMYIKRKWERLGYESLRRSNVSYDEDMSKGTKTVIFTYFLENVTKPIFEVRDCFEVAPGGVVTITSEMRPLAKCLPELPRVGKIIELDEKLNDVLYYGNGPYESYPDFKEHVRLGVFSKKADEFIEPYIRPQESGNRTAVRYVVVKNEDGEGIMFLANEELFNFGIKKLSDSDLAKCRHIEDLERFKSNRYYLSIDGHFGGVGSNSCGPRTLPSYRLHANEIYRISFVMVPFTNVEV